MKINPNARIENIVVQEVDQELLIYDLEVNKAFCLNETCGLVWQLCDGNNSIEEISHVLSGKLKMNVSEAFVWLALKELQKDNLLEDAGELTNHLAGIKRREMVKQVGLASMIALPIIASVVAPVPPKRKAGVGLMALIVVPVVIVVPDFANQ